MEWLTDEFGRRYRMIGNTKEYEMMIRVEGGLEIPESQLEAYNAVKRQQRETPKQELGRCPFKNGLSTSCSADCALFSGNGCKLVNGAAKSETIGKHCPFSSYQCAKECMFYQNGCSIYERR